MAGVVVIDLIWMDRIIKRWRHCWLIIMGDNNCPDSLNICLAFYLSSLFLLHHQLFVLRLLSFQKWTLRFLIFIFDLTQYLFIDSQIYLDFLLSDDSMRVFVSNLIFLMIAATLNGRFRNYESRHFFKEWIGSELIKKSTFW